MEVGRDLPGTIKFTPLVGDDVDLDPDDPLRSIHSAVLSTEPGSELFALSQLSARLSSSVQNGRAVVDLNHLLPFGAEVPNATSVRLSGPAEELAMGLRENMRLFFAKERRANTSPGPLRVAVLDSGLDPTYFGHRNVTYYDYAQDGGLRQQASRADPVGHGTRVARILDEILPVDVELVVGRLPAEPSKLTSLVVANALGDMVARCAPDVLNLSVAVRDSVFFCHSCRVRTHVPSFFPSIFPLMMRLARSSKSSTVTVMAAGNSGQVANSRWLTPDVDSVLLAVAQNRRGERTRYSSAPEGPLADLVGVRAFGGDDPDDPDAVGVFEDGTHGTSFAAPFVTAAALMAKHLSGSVFRDYSSVLSLNARWLIDMSSRGRLISLP